MLTQVSPPKTWPLSPNRIGLWLAILAFLHGLAYLALTPPWQAPDEPQHFQYVRFLLDERRLPTYRDELANTPLTEEVRQSMIRFDFWTWRDHDTAPPKLEYRLVSGHPPLYYGLATLALAPFVSLDVTAQLYIVRLFSLMLTALTVWISYRAMRALFPGSPALAAGVPLFIALLPMHAFIGSSVNNDTLAELTATVVIWLLAETFRRGLTWQRGAWLVVVLVAAILAKRTTLFLVPLVAISLLIVLPPRGRRRFAIAGALVILISLAIGRLSPGSYVGGLLRTARRLAHSSALPGLPELVLWGALLFTTFWGNFGWATVQLDATWYGLLLIVMLASVGGWVKLTWRRRRFTPALGACAMCALAILLISVQAVGLILVEGIHQQARYLFPAIVPLTMFLVLGWGAWIPHRWQGRALGLGAALFVIFDLVVLAAYQLPFYYG